MLFPPKTERRRSICSIHATRPVACRNYPWNRFGQFYFEACVFYQDGRLIPFEEATARWGEERVLDYCCRCNCCCFCSRTSFLPDGCEVSIIGSATDWWRGEGALACPMLKEIPEGAPLPPPGTEGGEQ